MKKNILIFSISLGVILLLGIGVSYSLWNISVSQDTINTATTKCFNVEITSQKNSISLENAYPISNEKGKKLTPFSFTITNACDIFASYTVSLESLKGTTLSSKFLNAMINNEEIKKLSDYEATDTVNTGSVENHILAKGSLGSGDSEDYTLRVWIDYDTTIEDLDNETKTFKSKIVVKAQPSSWSPVDEGYTTLHDAILANEYQTSPEVAIKKIEAKGTPDFSIVAPQVKWEKNVENDKKANGKKINLPIIGKSDYKTENLTINDYYLLLGKSYNFGETTGYYSLTDINYYNINELNFNYNNFYFCMAGVNFDADGVPTPYDSVVDCSAIYKVNSINRSTSSYDGISDYFINYEIIGNKLSRIEIEVDNSDKGLYKDVDDYGTTYYFRGNINNNNVFFAGFYWKIIRINGNGTIRLLYNSKTNNETIPSIGNSPFNSNFNNPAYAGYMYGKTIGTRDNNIKNEVNSTIKNYLDNWYKNNILNSKLSNYIGDSGFCNDRSLYSGDGNISDSSTSFGGTARYINNSPKFICPDNNDLFTNTENSIGNNSLEYSIGLITNDELIFAGMANRYINKRNYTFSEYHYWTMTPKSFSKFHNSVLGYFPRGGSGYIDADRINYNFSVRPVINLKADVKISGGIGTINDPYVVE